MKWFPIIAIAALILPSHEIHAVQATKSQDNKKVAEKKDDTKKPEFVRLRKDGKILAAMETNVVRYTDSIKYPGATVDLIGAIHLGDPKYYDQLNKLFEQYDVLLYEAVKDENADMAQGRPRGGAVGKDDDMSTDTAVGLSTIGILQVTMKDALGLEYQMQGIDYTKKNFVHADMTTREFQKSMRDRGETFGSMMLKEMGKSMGRQDQANPLASLDLGLSMLLPGSKETKQIRMRRIFADQLAKQDMEGAFADENGESVIVTERNKKALQVLEQQLDKGHKKIGIFYGAAHMPDMEKRMMEEFYFRRGDVKWVPAWDLRIRKKKKSKAKADAK